MNGIGVYAKAIFAALMAGLAAIYSALNGPNGNISDSEWVGIAIAALTALGVLLFPNAPVSVDTATAARARRGI